jgi:hypothetical protein
MARGEEVSYSILIPLYLSITLHVYTHALCPPFSLYSGSAAPGVKVFREIGRRGEKDREREREKEREGGSKGLQGGGGGRR